VKIFKHANGKAKGAKNAECLPSMHSATRKKRPCRFAHCIIPEHQPSAGRSGKSKKTEIQSRATGGKKTMKITIEKPGNYTVSDGEEVEVVGTGEGVVIIMTGGEVSTWDSSAPVIHQSGGEVMTLDTSAPVINMTGGEVRTCGKSAPVIIMTRGYVSTLYSSAPVITITGGDVWTFGSSAPVIHQSGGEVRTLGTSAPVINMTRGEVSTFGTSAPIINQSGGEVRTLEKSAPVIHKKKTKHKAGRPAERKI